MSRRERREWARDPGWFGFRQPEAARPGVGPRRRHRPLLAAGLGLLAAGALISPPMSGLWVRLHWSDRAAAWTAGAGLTLLGLSLIAWAHAGSGSPTADLRSVARRRPRLACAGLAVIAAAAALALIEGVFTLGALLPDRSAEEQSGSYTQDFFQPDPVLGYRPARSTRATSIKRAAGRTVYDVAYTIDGLGRRVTPAVPAGPRAGSPLVLFFGCSVTFGEGVEDDETLPYYFSEAAPVGEVLNYGFFGYGPQQMLAMLEDGRLDATLAGRNVLAVYTFIDAHVARSIGSLVVVTSWGVDMPSYELAGDGRLVRTGSFRSSRPALNWIYALASQSELLRRFRVDLPPPSRRHYRLTARILEESARLIAQRSRSSRFYLVLHPTVSTAARLKQEVAGADVVSVLDYSGLWRPSDPAYAIPDDWHPTPVAHRLLATRLARDVALGPAKP